MAGKLIEAKQIKTFSKYQKWQCKIWKNSVDGDQWTTEYNRCL